MVKRRALRTIHRLLARAPAVVLLGPRQVGKTTLARELARHHKGGATYLDLERPADLRRLDDADAYLRSRTGQLVVVDEIHRLPGLFGVLRGVIDDRRRAGDKVGHFLLLGSASLDLMRQASESLAGRVAYAELAPVDLAEAPARVANGERLWVRGGFPESLLARSDAASLDWRQQFIRSYLERDVPMFAPRMPAETIGRFWGMLAHGQGALLNQARIASSLSVSAPTVGRYLDLLVDLLLVRRLRPWSGNVGKRLVKAPKVYVRDAGIVHALLGIETRDDLLGHPIAGPSWEGFVIENLVAAAGPERIPLFMRTERGAEIDLLFERRGRIEMAVEIKRTTAPTVSKGFRIGCEDVRPKEAFIVHGGSGTWPLAGGVTAVSLAALVKQLLRR